MQPLSHEMAYQVLCLQLADDGRREVLLGSGSERASTSLLPFVVGAHFPGVYL